ncbi:MAG TPA: hypothetical protein VKB80_20390 [Kofleriaceae bacterium]|nr:hypothetical protein [Kofleriaceae bacterium]
MQRLICESCRTPPPLSARTGDGCARCGGSLEQHTRCPWCTAWARGPECGDCSAEVLSPHDFGAARMLVEAGVDRYALPERVRTLPRHRQVELSSRFDAQWSALQTRIDEARWVDRHLLTRSLAARAEDLLIARIPLPACQLRELTAGPRPPWIDDVARLREIADTSPLDETCAMASVALVHARGATRRDQDRTRAVLLDGDHRFADEAALAMGRWWVRSIDRESAHAVRERTAALLSDPVLGPWAAVSAARVAESDARRAELEPGLRAALESRDEDLRFAAALALVDEPALLRARAAADPDMRGRALRALAAAGSEAIAGDLASGGDEARREVLRGLAPPLGRALFEALLALLAGAGPDMQRDALGFLRARRFAALSGDERALLAGWMGRDRGRSLAVGLVLELLGWATEPVGDHPRDDAEIQPLVAAASSALSAASAEARAQVCREQRFEIGRWLFAVPAPEAAPVLDAWARDPAVAVPLVQAVIQLHATLNGWGRVPDDRALAHLFGLVDRAGADQALARTVGQALAAERGAAGRDRIVAGLWRRFVASPERRRAIAIAALPLRDVMAELRRAEGEAGELWPARDPARFFSVMAGADPLDAPALAREAAEASEAAGRCPPADLVDAVIAQVEPFLAGHPCTALWAVAGVASPVANHFRGAPRDAEAIASVAALRRGWARLSPRLWALSPVDEREARHDHLVEQIETELRLIAETQEQLVEQARREAERRAELARRAAEQAEALRHQREELERVQRELAAAASAARNPGGDSPWDEAVLPDQPLASLSAYARFLRALAGGGDMTSLLRRHEMTHERWTACAWAWSQLLAARRDLALRFSQLCSALAEAEDA